MIGRALLRFPVRSRLSRSTLFLFHAQQHALSARTPAALTLRSYATPGRPKSVVGEPSRPVKRAVKKAAAKPATGDSPAEKKVAAKKKDAATKSVGRKRKALTPEERAAKKEAEAARKEILNLRSAAKKEADKARAEKLKATTKARKEKVKVLADKAKWVELKKVALDPPKLAQANSYAHFLTEKMKAKQGNTNDSFQSNRERLGAHTKEIAAEWKSLNSSDVEHYNHMAHTKREASQAEYKRWVESHSAEEIHRANNARTQLRRKFPAAKGGKPKWPAIKDERAVKQPLSAYTQFAVNRHASGDFKNIPFVDRARLISQEWKALSDEEKKKYDNLYKQEQDRYKTEYSDTFGRAPPFYEQASRPQAMAASA